MKLGCQDVIQVNIVVKDPPEASFTADLVCQGSETQFTNTSTTPVGTLTDYRWDFDDDGLFDSFDENPTHTFPGSGTFPVTLEVENNQGCTDAVLIDVTVWGSPTASFAIDPGCPYESTQFNDESVPGSSDLVGWEWDFGDGSPPENIQNPIHTYLSNGAFDIDLVVEDENGCQDDTTIVLVQQKPVADFQAPTVCFR